MIRRRQAPVGRSTNKQNKLANNGAQLTFVFGFTSSLKGTPSSDRVRKSWVVLKAAVKKVD